MKSGLDVAKILLYGFALVFCAIGAGLVYGAVTVFQGGETTKAFLMLVAALAFGGVGLGVFALTIVGSRAQAREAALRAAHPDEPWMWREDWAAGRVRSTGRATAWFLWVFALLWNLISTPLLIFLPREIIENQNYPALLGLLFPLVGIGLIVAAVRKSIQRGKYGDCLFVMERVPGVLGGEVTGTILIPHGLPAAETIAVGLSCIHRKRQRSGKGTSTSEDVLWQAEQSVVRLSPTAEAETLGAALRFRIPYDATPTGEIDENNSILWKLEAGAAVPGVDFATVFEIPVFKTPVSSPQITEEQIRSEEVSASTPAIVPGDHAGIAVFPSARGGTEFVLKSRGDLPGMLSAVGILLMLSGIAAVLAYVGAPLIFPVVFGMFALLIALISFFVAFGESRIVVEEGYVSVRNSLLGIAMNRRLPCSSITRIGVRGDARGGRRGYYSITLIQEGQKSASPLQFLREKREADWLAEELRKAMEPWRGTTRSEGTGKPTPEVATPVRMRGKKDLTGSL